MATRKHQDPEQQTDPATDENGGGSTTKSMEYHKRQRENFSRLRTIAARLQVFAKRELDGTISEDVRLFNEMTRDLLAMGVPLDDNGDGFLYARDGMGRDFDGLSEEEAALHITPKAREESWKQDALRSRALRILAETGGAEVGELEQIAA